MELVCDESVDYEVISLLRKNNFSVYSISELQAGIPDDEVLNIAYQKGCLLITEDKDFGELTYRLNKPSYGILLIRLINVFGTNKANLVLQALKENTDIMLNSFSVLGNKKLRIKPLT